MKAKINNSKHVNTHLFSALADIQQYETTIKGAMQCLLDRFGPEHSLYLFNAGDDRILIYSRRHTKEIATINV